MTTQTTMRQFGPPVGAPGVEVLERSGGNVLADPQYGVCAMFGILKRGPMGVPIPLKSRKHYDDIFGDPGDSTWHLYSSGSHMTPDAVDGFFSTGGGAGRLWLTRLDLDGKARKAELILKNRFGSPALKISAASEGRWGGQANAIATTPVVVATSRTFTLIAEDIESNEFLGAEASFTGSPGKTYTIISNTASDPDSNEVVFTVGAQYDLIVDGVSGPVAIAGTATYTRYSELTGTAEFPLYVNATGTATANGTVVTGVGTAFSTEFKVGGNIYVAGEARQVESITSDTTLTIDSPFSAEGSGLTAQYDNLVVTGDISATFQTELSVGDMIYATIDGELQGRTVAAIASETELTLESGFTQALAAATTLSTDNLVVTGTTTAFDTDITAGQYIIDPNRSGETVKVVSVDSATEITIEKPFASNFTDAQLTKQNQMGEVELKAVEGEGLSIEIGQGTRFPETHFSLKVRFNEAPVLQINDLSLDPDDPLYAEPAINDQNVAYRANSVNYPMWITAENLWTSTYTTIASKDCRPANGAGQILAMTKETAYMIADFDYEAVVGNYFYPNPYVQPRSFFRVKSAQAPLALQGTIASTGTVVTGTTTNFTDVLVPGDYIYDPNTNTAQKIRAVNSDTEVIVETAFSTDIPALTSSIRLGYVKVDQGYDIGLVAGVGDYAMVSYPEYLTKGYDGDTANLIPYYFSKFADVDRNYLENAIFGKNQGLVRIACPGISDVSIQKAFAYYASVRAFEFRCEIPSFYQTAASAESYVLQTLGRDDFISVAFPSYGYISNPLGAGDRMVSLTGEIFGGESRQSVAVQGYHNPFAGMDAMLPRINKLPFEPMPVDEAILNVAGIQPIKTQDGRVIVFGGRLPSRSPTYDFLHVRRIQSNYVRIFLEARVLMELLFRPNQPQLLDQVIMILNNFARREYNKRVLTNYLSFTQATQIQGNLSNQGVVSDVSSQDAIVETINGKLKIFFRYVPTGILERLSLEVGPDILVAQFGNTVNSSSL